MTGYIGYGGYGLNLMTVVSPPRGGNPLTGGRLRRSRSGKNCFKDR